MYNAQSDRTTVQPVLGGVYITFNYLVVDYERGQFQLAPAVQGSQSTSSQAIKAICTPTPTSSSLSGGSPASSPQNISGKTGAIVGDTVGGVAGLAMMGVLVFLFRRYRHRRFQESTTVPGVRTAQQSSGVLSVTQSENQAPSSPSKRPLSLASSVH